MSFYFQFCGGDSFFYVRQCKFIKEKINRPIIFNIHTNIAYNKVYGQILNSRHIIKSLSNLPLLPIHCLTCALEIKGNH